MTGNAKKFLRAAWRLTRDARHRQTLRTALQNYENGREQRQADFLDWPAARQAAAETKWEAVNQLDQHLNTFAEKIALRGTKVHWASTDREACQIIARIIQTKGARLVIKSSSMTAEEIHLNQALAVAGFEVTEGELGEFVLQLRREAPYHIVFPALHLADGEIRDSLQRQPGNAPSDNPEDPIMAARSALREKFLAAEVGITGANFAIAETGMISITENEGNARLTAALPKTMITLLGIEKVLPRFEDLALFLPMLATAGSGQAMTVYNTLYGGPRQFGENDGPTEFHVVLLDNRRTKLLADAEQRDVLHCIRCGACLNVCPVFRHVGGHAYGTTYPGPIGAALTPFLRNLPDWKHLSEASTLCGACTEACPVKIDLHRHLLQNRRTSVSKRVSYRTQFKYDVFTSLVNHPAVWSLAKKAARLARPLHNIVKGRVFDPWRWWSKTRDLPPLPQESFKDWWRKRK